MTYYVKLVDLGSGSTVDIQCNLDKYLNSDGIAYFSRKRWKHAFVRIPRFGLHDIYKNKFSVYAIESEPLTVGRIADFRASILDTFIKVTCNNGHSTLYSGEPGSCPAELRDCEVKRTRYNGRTLFMEVNRE